MGLASLLSRELELFFLLFTAFFFNVCSRHCRACMAGTRWGENVIWVGDSSKYQAGKVMVGFKFWDLGALSDTTTKTREWPSHPLPSPLNYRFDSG